MMRRIGYLLLLLFPSFCFSQSDEINISAAFEQSIELQIVGNANCSFTFSSIAHYTNGFTANGNHGSNHIQFQIASSTNFQVDMSNTAFTDGAGNTLDARYFHVRLQYQNAESDYKDRYDWGPSDGFGIKSTLSGAYILAEGVTRTVVIPGPNGNAGNFEDNDFKIRIGVGVKSVAARNNLPIMLDANITPGTYTSVLTLTAVPVIL
ncbi:MAG: hypothetical protein AAF388_13520 [Bacteroidota bacterium]